MQLKLATYNIRRCIGSDGQKNPDRISEVLAEINPDILALQEVEYVHTVDDIDFTGKDTSLYKMLGPTMLLGQSNYGNVLVSRFPPVAIRKINLSYPGRERRGALDVDLDCRGTVVRVIATHLGLRPVERRNQARKLLAVIDDPALKRDITILMGDMNEWFLWGRPLRWIHDYFGSSRDVATYPARFPVLALDKIWCHPAPLLIRLRKHRTRLAGIASDHLPLVGYVDLSESRSL
ncbi:MAG: endonuclease/exonuclease/phosphatase family protein [Desulfobulbaceae bacterium]|nr:endonuclease/exonuclease/phosphatase family protein [Desulfobulbaceae bacterium]